MAPTCCAVTLCVGPSLPPERSEAVPNEEDLALSGQQRQGVGGHDWHRKVGWPGSAALLGRPSLEHTTLRLGFFFSFRSPIRARSLIRKNKITKLRLLEIASRLDKDGLFRLGVWKFVELVFICFMLYNTIILLMNF